MKTGYTPRFKFSAGNGGEGPWGVVSFKGYYGDLAIVVAKTSIFADNGTEKRYLPEGTGSAKYGGRRYRCYGAIQDSELAEGIVAATTR